MLHCIISPELDTFPETTTTEKNFFRLISWIKDRRSTQCELSQSFRVLTMEFVVRQRKAVCMRSQNKMLPWLQGGKMRLSVCDISRSGWTADNVWLNSCMEAGRLTAVCLWDPWCAVQVLRYLPLSQHSQLLQHVTRSHPQISHPVLIVLGSTQTQLKKSVCACDDNVQRTCKS